MAVVVVIVLAGSKLALSLSFAFVELTPDPVVAPLMTSILGGIAGGMVDVPVLQGLVMMAGRADYHGVVDRNEWWKVLRQDVASS